MQDAGLGSEDGGVGGMRGGVLCGCKRYELAIHEEPFESALFTAGSQLKVGTFLVVYVQGSLPASRAKIAFDLIHQPTGHLHRYAYIGLRDR
ncbi:MAG TPA: hypothetical protein VEG61_06590 [Candidatus Dormibacteraeota bacterium]|nr:hypothetical protein [Candidatus Dormibacteraeota bacterium]